MIKPIVFPVLVCLSIGPVFAQDVAPVSPAEVDQGVSLMQQGAKLLLKGLMSNMKPAMDDMSRAIAEMQPGLQNLITMMGDVGNYHAPEMLSNGDIIIRHKTPAEMLQKAPETDL